MDLEKLVSFYGKWPSFALIALSSCSRLVLGASLLGWSLYKLLQ